MDRRVQRNHHHHHHLHHPHHVICLTTGHYVICLTIGHHVICLTTGHHVMSYNRSSRSLSYNRSSRNLSYNRSSRNLSYNRPIDSSKVSSPESTPPCNSQYLLVCLRLSSSSLRLLKVNMGIHKVEEKREGYTESGEGRSTGLLSMVSAYIFMLHSWRWLTSEVFTTLHVRTHGD
jgi:hypothetical protein